MVTWRDRFDDGSVPVPDTPPGRRASEAQPAAAVLVGVDEVAAAGHLVVVPSRTTPYPPGPAVVHRGHGRDRLRPGSPP